MAFEYIRAGRTRGFCVYFATGVSALGIAGPAHAQTAAVDQPRSEAPSDTSAEGRNAGATTPGATSRNIEEVMVSAQRRTERLQDVPISMSVLGGVDLDKATARGVQEVLRQVPGVTLQDHLVGGGSQVQVRGVSAGTPISSGTSTTAYYLDWAPFGLARSAIAPDLNAYDLERVEILRGPQGTLYGASALNGTVRALTNDANLDEFEFKARASTAYVEEGGADYRGDMALNLPLIHDKVAARLVAGYQDLSGWIDKAHDEDANDAQIANLRLKVNAQPTDELSIGLLAWRSRSDRGAPSGDDGHWRNPSRLDEPLSTDYDIYGMKVDYEFAGFTASSMTSYLDYSNHQILDGAPAIGVHFTGDQTARSFAQELVLNSTHPGNWRWSVGTMYRDVGEWVYAFIRGLYVAPSLYRPESKSYAVFGELTRALFDNQLELTAGLRYFEDDGSLTEHSRLNGAPASQLVSDADTFRTTTPRLAVTWRPSEQMTVYASYGEGFRSGIFQHPTVLQVTPYPPGGPDHLKNYELGAKATLWEGSLNFDASLYYIDWQDLQQEFIVRITPILAAPAFINGDSASGLGVDFGATVEPAKGLTLGASFSWNDLTMDTDVFSGGVLLFEKGQRLNWSPEYTAAASADYAFAIGDSGYEGRISASANYTSEQLRTGLVRGAREVLVSDRLLTARTSFTIDSPDQWSVTLFADNVNNERGVTSPNPLPAIPLDTRVRPRTIGVQLDYRY